MNYLGLIIDFLPHSCVLKIQLNENQKSTQNNKKNKKTKTIILYLKIQLKMCLIYVIEL